MLTTQTDAEVLLLLRLALAKTSGWLAGQLETQSLCHSPRLGGGHSQDPVLDLPPGRSLNCAVLYLLKLMLFLFLPDNLFKPKERCISEKEMHMRSKRYLTLAGGVERAGLGGLKGPDAAPRAKASRPTFKGRGLLAGLCIGMFMLLLDQP